LCLKAWNKELCRMAGSAEPGHSQSPGLETGTKRFGWAWEAEEGQ